MRRALIWMAGAIIPFFSGLGETTFYVAKDGKDNQSGSLEKPFATLERARDEIRKIKLAGELKTPVTVYVRGGKYFLTETFRLGEQDSGTSDAGITYAAYSGEKVILSGGCVLGGWKTYKDKIIQSEVPKAWSGEVRFRQLFANGKRQIRARYPNFEPENPLYGGWLTIQKELSDSENQTAFGYADGTFPRFWSKPEQGEINIIPCCCGVQRIIPMASVDEEKRVITVTGPLILPPYENLMPAKLVEPIQSWLDMGLFVNYCGRFKEKSRYYVENLIEELDTPGEWCVDSETRTVYYWPETPIEGLEVVAPRLNCLIDMAGVSHIKISGLTFTETDGGDNYHHEGGHGYGPMYPMRGLKYCGDAVHLKNARQCVIEKNVFDAVGGNAVYLEGFNSRNRVSGNEIGYVGAGAVSLVGSEEKHPLYNIVENNHIHHTGVYSKYAPAVFLGMSDANFVRHNLIEHVPHHAINLGNNCFGRNYVEYNRIRFSCQETADTGAINSWMEGGSSGTVARQIERAGHVIRYNYLSDIPGPKAVEAGVTHITFGIYLDNYSSNCVVQGNVVVRVSHAGIIVHDGKNNLIENNILVDNGSQMRFQEVWRPLGLGFMSNNCFRRNILYFGTKKAVFDLQYCSERTVAESDNNLIWNHDGGDYKFLWRHIDDTISSIDTFKVWQLVGYDAHSVIAEPQFVDPAKDDYHLSPQSPAMRLGFVPIPFEKIGICSEKAK